MLLMLMAGSNNISFYISKDVSQTLITENKKKKKTSVSHVINYSCNCHYFLFVHVDHH